LCLFASTGFYRLSTRSEPYARLLRWCPSPPAPLPTGERGQGGEGMGHPHSPYYCAVIVPRFVRRCPVNSQPVPAVRGLFDPPRCDRNSLTVGAGRAMITVARMFLLTGRRLNWALRCALPLRHMVFATADLRADCLSRRFLLAVVSLLRSATGRRLYASGRKRMKPAIKRVLAHQPSNEWLGCESASAAPASFTTPPGSAHHRP
jgi:hypothetical protein